MKNTKKDISVKNYHLQTSQVIAPFAIPGAGTAQMVTKDDFPVLNGVTCYTLEIWQESMRLPHWHPNVSELGYVVSGSIEVILWRSPGETAVFTLTEGMCWFIPQASLHCLNNLGPEPAQLLVGFSSDQPQDIDLHVAFNGVPAALRDAYTSPHTQLREWHGSTQNVLVGPLRLDPAVHHVLLTSPYGFDLAQTTPLFSDTALGSVIWAVKSNWSILKNISLLRARLKPGASRDAIWYPDAGTLYVVARGTGRFTLIIAHEEPHSFDAGLHDYIFVPTGVLHTFCNNGTDDFEVIAFFTQDNPQPEVSLSVSTAFFPPSIIHTAMTHFGNEQEGGNPLKNLKHTKTSPYLLKLESPK